jgi:tRNA pseudouridine synthase 10
MTQGAWRKMRMADVLARPAIRAGLAQALAAGPLCDHCLGRLAAGADTGLANDARGRAVREALAAPAPPATCGLCGGLFGNLDAWAARAAEALRGWEFGTLGVATRPDPQVTQREEALRQTLLSAADAPSPWAAGNLVEPYRQEFGRLLGLRLAALLGCEAALKDPDVWVFADLAAGSVTIQVEPLFVCGRYRKLVRGISQTRWAATPTSVQDIVGDPVCRAAEGKDHSFHGCGREDVDVRCLGERPFALQVISPRRRRLDWAALAAEIGRSGRVEVLDLAPCRRPAVAHLKELRPEKTYRALVRLASEVDDAALARLEGLVGAIRQRTPLRVLRRRPDLERDRRIVSLRWRHIDGRTIEVEVRTQAGLYVKELVSGDQGRTRPSVAEVLGVPAECEELDVMAVHVDASFFLLQTKPPCR